MVATLLRAIGASAVLLHGTTAALETNKAVNPPGITVCSLMDSTDEILCITLSRDGKIVASLSQKGWIHIWEAPQDGKLGETLKYAEALHKVNIVNDLSMNEVEALRSNKVTKSITVANSNDVCAVSFVPSEKHSTDKSNCLGKEIVEGHIGPALQRVFKRSNIESDNTNSGYYPIVIPFPSKIISPCDEDPPDTPDTPLYNKAEEGKAYPLPEPKITPRRIHHCSSTAFFDVDAGEGIFVCSPPYVYVYHRSNYNIIRTIYFNIRRIMQPLDNDLNVSDLHSKVNRFALMYQSLPQFNQESCKLRMAMLLNTRAMDVRWERRFALSSDGSRLVVLSNVNAKGVPSQFITVHILLMKTGLEVIRWRAEITPSKLYFHDSGDKLYIITEEQQLLLYDLNTGKIITKSTEPNGNRMCLHSSRHYYFKPADNAIKVETLVPTPMDEGKTFELKLMGYEQKQRFQDNQWTLEIVQDSKCEQWVCCINNSNDSEVKKFSFQPVGKKLEDDEQSPSNKFNKFNNKLNNNFNKKFNNKFRFAVTETGAVLVITSVTVQLWSSTKGANYTLCDFWCISKLGRFRTVIDLKWDGMRVEPFAKDKVRIVLRIKEDEEPNSKGYYEIVMNSSDNMYSSNVLDSDAPDLSAPNTFKVEEQMAFSCCCYLMLLSRMICEKRCDWAASPREIEKVPELTVEIKETLQQYIPAYRYPRIHIRFIGSPILYLFNFEDLDAVFAEYRNYRRLIFAWIYESDESPEALFSYVSDNVVQAKIVRWLIRKTQCGETAYGLLLQRQLPTLMCENPELVKVIARALSYHVCVAPIVEKQVFLRQARWPAKPDLHNLDMEILTRFNHLEPIIQFTDHVDFPNGFKFVWLAIASRCRKFLSLLGQYKQYILQFYPNFSSRLRSGYICVVPLLELCSYDVSGKSTFTRIAEITLERNFVEIAEPFLEAVVNHKWRAFARRRFYLLSVVYILYFTMFTILLYKDSPGTNQLSSKDIWIPGLFCAIAGCFIILELSKLWRRPRAYLFILSNYLELCAFIIPIWYASWSMQSYPVPPGLRSASILLIWFRLLMHLRINKSIGIFIAVISEILRKMIPFLVVVMMAYIGFTQAFYELLRHTLPVVAPDGVVEGTIDNTFANLSFIPVDSNGQNYTQDFTTVMINVFFFTTQNYSTMATFEPNVTLFLILFAAVIGIVLFNVLIALLNNVYTNALESGQRLWLLLFVQIVADIEVLPFIGAHQTRTDWFPPYIYYIAYDSEIKAYEKAIASDDDGARQQILKWGPDQQFSDVWENIPDVVEALFNYKPEGKKNHLSLERGERIDVIRSFPSGWWYGKRGKERGLFPCNFVGPYTAKRQSRSTGHNVISPDATPELDTTPELNTTPELDTQYDGRLWFPSEGPLPTPRND